MNRILILILISLGSCHSTKVEKVDFSFGEYQFNAKIEALLAQTKDGGIASTDFSFVSENERLVNALTIDQDTIVHITKESWDRIQNEYKFKDAVDHIIQEAEQFDFLLINEAHYFPQHRNFVKRLIPELSKLGYTYLALEGIGMMKNGKQYDTEIEKRGYPKRTSGNYIAEPEFGNLIREGVKYGFKIIGYDGGSGEDREVQGAENILNSIKKNGSNGKTLVLCGWDHIKEVETGTYWEYALAGRIKQMTGKEVLTVNQTEYYERGNKIYEDSIYQWFDGNESMVFLDSKDQSFDVQKNKDWYDLFVFHPRTNYVDGFPDWFIATTELKNFKIPNIEIQCPCKIFVYDINDDFKIAVPLYIFEFSEIPKKIKIPTLEDSRSKIILSNGKEHFLVE